MRAAQVDDAWRRVQQDRGFAIDRIVARDKPPFEDFDRDDFPRGVLVLCGLNGAGKSTLARLAARSLGLPVAPTEARPALASEHGFQMELLLDATSYELPRELNPARDAGMDATYLDAAVLCARLDSVMSQEHFADLMSGVDPASLSDGELADARYIVGRSYESIEIFEIEDTTPEPVFDDAVLPYFRVLSEGVAYESSAMGLGELAALSLLWSLKRVDANTVLILEEPETYLASASTVALMNVLVRTAAEKRIHLIVTTHSMAALRHVPLESIRILRSPGSGRGTRELRQAESREQLEELLGAPAGAGSRVAFVEDRAARCVLVEILAAFGGVWGAGVEVVAVGGEARVFDLCSTIPSLEGVAVVGVVDGDMSDRLQDDTRGWPVTALPGDRGPDEMAREAAEADPKELARRLNRSASAVADALEAVRPADAHDWVGAVGENLGIGFDDVIRAAAWMWLKNASPESTACYENVRKAFLAGWADI